jgi:hypothetical protein
MLTDNAKYGRLTTMLIVWLAISITASKLLIFHAGSKYAAHPPIPLGLAVLLPIAFFLVWFTASRRFRQFVLSLNPTALTIAQTWRIGGITFVTLQAFHILPGVFAQPAGWGDLSIGLTAPFVALYFGATRPQERFYRLEYRRHRRSGERYHRGSARINRRGNSAAVGFH